MAERIYTPEKTEPLSLFKLPVTLSVLEGGRGIYGIIRSIGGE
jgi:hypothetical protein